MKVLWAPWRMAYIKKNPIREDSGCFFCSGIAGKDDGKNLVVHRGKNTTIFMNRYPYNNGHLMVVPNRHLAEPGELDRGEIIEIHQMIALSLDILRKTIKPDGFNIGLNLGKVAGAGLRGHIHWHIVPRWEGDTNFMPVLAETKVMPEHLSESWIKLHRAFKKERKR